MLIPGLEDLLFPITPAKFFETYWPENPLFIPASDGKLSSLFSLPQLQDLESLIEARTLQVRACLPDHDDEYSSLLLAPEDCLKAYRNNMTLVFDSMQTQDDEIKNTLLKIQSDLGLPTGGEANDLTRARAMVYATPAGGRTGLHFDANANFVIQLRGTKRWALAKNTSVDYPTERYTSRTGELADTLDRQCHAELLDDLPEGSPEFLLQPGSILFVPRGYWHETSTEDDSLSLNFTFTQPTWADILAKSIHGYLLQSAQWRALADGLESADPTRNEQSIKRFESLLAEFTRELPSISARQLLMDICRIRG